MRNETKESNRLSVIPFIGNVTDFSLDYFVCRTVPIENKSESVMWSNESAMASRVKHPTDLSFHFETSQV